MLDEKDNNDDVQTSVPTVTQAFNYMAALLTAYLIFMVPQRGQVRT
jgi:hypothetical protein